MPVVLQGSMGEQPELQNTICPLLFNIDLKYFDRFKRPDASRPKPSFNFPFPFESGEELWTAFRRFGGCAAYRRHHFPCTTIAI
jgi:hypothetical protein